MDTVNASRLIKTYGFCLVLQMMTGLPGDTVEKAISTARKIIALEPSGVRIYPAVTLPNTKMWDMAVSGQYTPQSVEEAVKVCAKLIPLFVDAGISVLRVGLMDNEILARGEVMGAYHPALGELCYSEVFYNKARELLSSHRDGGNVTLHVPQGMVSKMVGQHSKNISRIKAEFSIKNIKVRESDQLNGFDISAEKT